MTIYVPGKLTLAKEFTPQSYMYEFPSQYPVWTSADITTALWLDAADASTITESGGAVSQWDDKSGNSNHATQTTPANRPALGTNEIIFNGSNAFMQTPATLSGSALTFFIVCNAQSTSLNTTGRVWAALGADGSTNGYFHLIYRSNISNYVRLQTASDGNAANFTQCLLSSQYSFPSASIFSCEYSATSALFLDGALQSSNSTVAPNFSNERLYLGTYFVVGQYLLNGSIFEVILTTSSLSVSTRQKAEGYLAHKWGLTANLPADHPYKSAAPTA